MTADVLQSPADPEATFRAKAGKEHRGYVANLTKTVDANGSVVTDYQYDVNKHSDIEFLKEVTRESKKKEEPETIIADGAYGSKEVTALAAEKNITVKTTGLLGHKEREILSEFQLSEDEHTVLKCPEGHEPLHSSFDAKRNRIRISFLRSQCEQCPHRKECLIKLKVRTAKTHFSLDAFHKLALAEEHRTHEEWKKIGRIRNGRDRDSLLHPPK